MSSLLQFLSSHAVAGHPIGTPGLWDKLYQLVIQCASQTGHADIALATFEEAYGSLSGGTLDATDETLPAPPVATTPPTRHVVKVLIEGLCDVGEPFKAFEVLSYAKHLAVPPSPHLYHPIVARIAKMLTEPSSELDGGLSTEHQELLLKLALDLHDSMVASCSPESLHTTHALTVLMQTIQCCTAVGDYETAVRVLQRLQVCVL